MKNLFYRCIRVVACYVCLFCTVPMIWAQEAEVYFEDAYFNTVWQHTAMAYEGNPLRIQHVMNKAADGRPVNICFIGGSITAGASASDPAKAAYAPRTVQWLEERFPNTEFRYINAGIGATNSIYGVHRLEDDVLKYKPDLVVIEFAVNDRGEKDAAEAYEGLLRKLLQYTPDLAVLALATLGDKGDNAQGEHLKVCKHYAVPLLSYRDVIWPEIQAGRLRWPDISADDVHPNDRGHAYIAGLIAHYLDGIYKQSDVLDAKISKLPGSLTVNGYEKSHVYVPDQRISMGSWKEKNGAFITHEKGEPLVIKVKAGYINVMYTRTNENWAGKAYVLIDGKERVDLDADFSAGWGTYQKNVSIWRKKKKGWHTLAFYYDDDRMDKSFVLNRILLANY